MLYNGYSARVEFDDEDSIFGGYLAPTLPAMNFVATIIFLTHEHETH